jgi:hypothetical protein
MMRESTYNGLPGERIAILVTVEQVEIMIMKG